jgi:hypothetical protein
VRLRVLDAQKARQLLQGSAETPWLAVEQGRVQLHAIEDLKAQVGAMQNGSVLFALYPNTGNAVKPGAPVVLQFGDARLEAIDAQ